MPPGTLRAVGSDGRAQIKRGLVAYDKGRPTTVGLVVVEAFLDHRFSWRKRLPRVNPGIAHTHRF